jgi:hypothetical protein
MTRARLFVGLVVGQLGLWVTAAPGVLAADEAEYLRRIEALERRIEQLEAQQAGQPQAQHTYERQEPQEPEESPATDARQTTWRDGLGVPEWTKRVSLSGSANAGYFNGEGESIVPDSSFQVWDTRFFVDADLGHDATIGNTTILRNAGFLFEWNLVRLGELENDVGELYADLQGVLGSSWLGVQVGRFQIPVGENYLRYSLGYRDNPFISDTIGGPWWWDEGLRFYGASTSGRYGYVASVSDGETPFNADQNPDVQGTLKLFARPTDWLHLSVSGLRSGKVGSNSSPALGALWLGEAFPRAFGSGTDVPSFDHGAPIADGPNRLESVSLLGGDVIFTLPDITRLWLAFGATAIDSDGPSVYDRTLYYWIAEVLLYGGMVSETLAPLYVGARANGLGTYDDAEGYLLDRRYASTLGYNMESAEAYSLVLGWKLFERVTLRGEYTFYDIGLVRGVDDAIRNKARDANYFALDARIAF